MHELNILMVTLYSVALIRQILVKRESLVTESIDIANNILFKSFVSHGLTNSVDLHSYFEYNYTTWLLIS